MSSKNLDQALQELEISQHKCIESIRKSQGNGNSSEIIHACTDITGFGLLGHLEEMLLSNKSQKRKEG